MVVVYVGGSLVYSTLAKRNLGTFHSRMTLVQENEVMTSQRKCSFCEKLVMNDSQIETDDLAWECDILHRSFHITIHEHLRMLKV